MEDITYTVGDMGNNPTHVSVTYTDSTGNVYIREINVPYSDGILDTVEWNERLESHLRSVYYKRDVGLITFIPPSL